MYEVFYGLRDKPFQLNPDPEFFFASRGHARAYAYLQYGLHKGQGFIVVTGDAGAGKTTLVRSLLQRLDSRKVVAAQLVSAQIDAVDLVKSVAAAFGLPAHTTDKAQLLAHLEAFLTNVAHEQRRALLIVDEAHNLTPRAIAELRMLSDFQVRGRALLQTFIVGQPELRLAFQSGALHLLRQQVIASYHLGPMDRMETQGYIEHRLRRVGWKGDPAFESSAFDALHVFSGGVPRRINLLCNRAMLAAYLGEKHVITAPDVQSVSTELRQELVPKVVQPALAAVARGAKPVATLPVATTPASEFAKLEDRVARLERLVHTLVEREQRGRFFSRSG